MKTDQDHYKEVIEDLKSEKMNWDFEDFLKKTESTEIKSLPDSTTKSSSLPKFFWMAACVVLFAALMILFKVFNTNQIEKQDVLVKNEILKHKKDFGKTEEIVAVNSTDSLKTVQDSLITDSASTEIVEDVTDKILPKRGRLKKQFRQQYVQNSEPIKPDSGNTTSNEYQSGYVLINGQKIENEQDAIDLTKYSFRILSENVSKTVAQTEAVSAFIND